MIEPTVGRVLYFTPGENDYWLLKEEAPFAAMIAKVNADGTLNLGVLDPGGRNCPRENVTLIQGQLRAEPEKAFCTWMDYQRGQAAKSDEIVAALTARIEALEAAAVLEPKALSAAEVDEIFRGQITSYTATKA